MGPEHVILTVSSVLLDPTAVCQIAKVFSIIDYALFATFRMRIWTGVQRMMLPHHTGTACVSTADMSLPDGSTKLLQQKGHCFLPACPPGTSRSDHWSLGTCSSSVIWQGTELVKFCTSNSVSLCDLEVFRRGLSCRYGFIIAGIKLLAGFLWDSIIGELW